MLQLLHFPATQLFLELAEVEELVEVALLPGLLPGFLGVNPLEKAPVAVHETKASVHKSVADLSFLPAHLLCHLFQKFLLACLLCFPCFLTRLLPNLLEKLKELEKLKKLEKLLSSLLACLLALPLALALSCFLACKLSVAPHKFVLPEIVEHLAEKVACLLSRLLSCPLSSKLALPLSCLLHLLQKFLARLLTCFFWPSCRGA